MGHDITQASAFTRVTTSRCRQRHVCDGFPQSLNYLSTRVPCPLLALKSKCKSPFQVFLEYRCQCMTETRSSLTPVIPYETLYVTIHLRLTVPHRLHCVIAMSDDTSSYIYDSLIIGQINSKYASGQPKLQTHSTPTIELLLDNSSALQQYNDPVLETIQPPFSAQHPFRHHPHHFHHPHHQLSNPKRHQHVHHLLPHHPLPAWCLHLRQRTLDAALPDGLSTTRRSPSGWLDTGARPPLPTRPIFIIPNPQLRARPRCYLYPLPHRGMRRSWPRSIQLAWD